jgi:hypothetical protein
MYGKRKQHFNWNEIMSIRCKVCNALKIVNNKIDASDDWECQNCGSIFDSNDNYVTVG